MKKTVIIINVLALLFAAYTLVKITSSGYQEILLSPEKIESYQNHVQSEQDIDKMREIGKTSVKHNGLLSNLLGKGMGLFQKSVIVFLFVALANIVVMALPKKRVEQDDD